MLTSLTIRFGKRALHESDYILSWEVVHASALQVDMGRHQPELLFRRLFRRLVLCLGSQPRQWAPCCLRPPLLRSTAQFFSCHVSFSGFASQKKCHHMPLVLNRHIDISVAGIMQLIMARLSIESMWHVAVTILLSNQVIKMSCLLP